MKKSAFVLGFVGLGVLVTACSGGADDPAPFGEAPSTVSDKLGALTGATWRMEPGLTSAAALYYASGESRAVLPNAQTSPTDILALLAPFASDLGLSADLSRELDAPETLLDASDEDVGTYRFKQHIPGTDVPVFDAALVVAVTKEGKLEYLSTSHARNLAAVAPNPSLSGEVAADRAVQKLGSSARKASVPALGVVAVDPMKPRLGYRFVAEIDGESFQVDCDAHSGEVLTAVPRAASATAFSAAHYFDGDDIRQDKHAKMTVTLNPKNELAVRGPSGLIVVNDENDKPATCAPSASDPGTYECDVNVPAGNAKGVAVDVQSHLVGAARYFGNQLGTTQWKSSGSGKVEASVNVRTTRNGRDMRGDGRYENGKLAFGVGQTFEEASQDPQYRGNKTYKNYPTGISFEFVVHEYAHGVISSAGYLSNIGEAGALSEGLADIFAAHAEALVRNSADSLVSFGEETRFDNQPLRHFRHPDKGVDVGGTVDYAKKKATRPTNAVLPQCQGPAPTLDCFTQCWPDRQMGRSENDCGNVHYNSTIVSNAWSLLAVGGFNESTKKGVLAEAGLSRATRLFYAATVGAPAYDTMKNFATRMIKHQIDRFIANPFKTDLEPWWVKKAVVCAWNAVNVIPDNEVINHAVGPSCPTAGTLVRTCKGKADGYYCNPDVASPYDSYQCKNGSIAAGHQCASGSFCHRLTLNPESPAMLDSQNKPRCFLEPLLSEW